MSKHNRELSVYMEGVNKYPLLSREEEIELAQHVRSGDQEAKDKLVVSNLRFVVQVANQFKAYTKSGKYSILDLIQEGNDGLIHAASKFDHRKGYRFITYAVWWIRARIMNFIIRSHSMVKIGTTANERKLFFKMSHVRRLLSITDQEERDKAREHLARKLKTSTKLIKKMEDRLWWNDVSLEKPLLPACGDSTQRPALRDFLTDEESLEKELDERNFVSEARNQIEESMVNLTEREQDIIRRRYLSDDGATLQSIATSYGLSRERIRQIESRAFKKMKVHLLSNDAGRELVKELNLPK